MKLAKPEDWICLKAVIIFPDLEKIKIWALILPNPVVVVAGAVGTMLLIAYMLVGG
nr:hypothetical protein [Pedobacter sp. ASV2]